MLCAVTNSRDLSLWPASIVFPAPKLPPFPDDRAITVCAHSKCSTYSAVRGRIGGFACSPVSDSQLRRSRRQTPGLVGKRAFGRQETPSRLRTSPPKALVVPPVKPPIASSTPPIVLQRHFHPLNFAAIRAWGLEFSEKCACTTGFQYAPCSSHPMPNRPRYWSRNCAVCPG